MTVARLIFVANARLPTEKAHGHAIVKLCEAFASLGVDVELWHPRRHQLDPALAGQSVFTFYGLRPSFSVVELANLDVVRLERFLPAAVFQALFMAHEAAWGEYVARRAAQGPADIYLTRDVLVARALARRGLPTLLDVHSVPRGPRRRAYRRLAALPDLRGVIALTDGNREALVDAGVTPGSIVVSGSAVDVAQYNNLPGKYECRIMHGLPTDRPIIGHIGRLETLGQDKCIADLIRAVALVTRQLNPAPLLLFVGGPLDHANKYLAIARAAGLEPGDMRLVDHVPSREVPTWIAGLDVGVALFPSTRHMGEFASPLKIFEYAAAGVPIVTSDLPAVREALSLCGDGTLVPPHDHVSLAAALLRVLHTGTDGVQATKTDRAIPTWTDKARTILAMGVPNALPPRLPDVDPVRRSGHGS